MTRKRCGISILILAAAVTQSVGSAANKETIELQRDVAQLQDEVRTLQRSFDERMAALQVLMQQTLDNTNKASASVAVLDNALRERMASQEAKVVGPVAGVGTKLDAMTNTVQDLQGAVNDLTSRMGKIQQQLVDISTALRTMPAPSAPPITSSIPQAASPAGRPPVEAGVLYPSAVSDMTSGKYELALGEFQDYLKYYGNTDLAPNAQFYIGQVHYSQSKFDLAIADFDAVLEQYQDNIKTPDAHFMKGKALFQIHQRDKAAKEFQAILEKFPRSGVAANARAQLREMGLNPAAATASTAPKPRRRR